MPDDVPIFDLHTPYPKAIIEGLRRAVVAELQRIDDAFLMLLTTCDFAQSTLNTVLAGQAAIGQLQTAVGHLVANAVTTTDALTARLDELALRIAALEAAGAPGTAPDPSPAPQPVPDPQPADQTPAEET